MSETVFKGFSSRAEVTPLPNIFFTEVTPSIESIAELKILMHIFFLLSRRKGYPRFVTFTELKNEPVLLRGLLYLKSDTDVIIEQSLKDAVKHGFLLHTPVTVDENPDEAYFINNQTERDTIAKIMDGSLTTPKITIRKIDKVVIPKATDIYSLYEQNIGLLTPIIAEELQEAEHRYSADWIRDAFKEALKANVRNWKYIHSILKRWEREGRKEIKPASRVKASSDPDKYNKGKYGHVVRS